MRVLKHRQNRPSLGQAFELCEKRLQCFPLLGLRREVERRVSTVHRYAEESRDEWDGFGEIVCSLGKQRHELGEPHRRRVVTLERRRSLELVDEWPEHGIGVVG